MPGTHSASLPLPFAVRTVLFLLVLSTWWWRWCCCPSATTRGYVLPRAFDLGRQTAKAWAVDWLKGTLVGAALGTLIGAGFMWIVLSWPDSWWWIFWRAGHRGRTGPRLRDAICPGAAVLQDAAAPRRGDTTRIHRLVERAGTPVKDVCTLDFSRRTAEANAAVIGIGRSRRVVLADTLLAEFEPGEVDAVVAHELGHHVHRDVQRLLVGNAVLIWFGLAVAAWAAPAALPVLSLPSLGYVPASRCSLRWPSCTSCSPRRCSTGGRAARRPPRTTSRCG